MLTNAAIQLLQTVQQNPTAETLMVATTVNALKDT